MDDDAAYAGVTSDTDCRQTIDPGGGHCHLGISRDRRPNTFSIDFHSAKSLDEKIHNGTVRAASQRY